MTEIRSFESEPTAVDDVRRVRERIDRESGGDLQKHVEETNRIFEQLREKLNIRVVPAPSTKLPESRIHG
jgi:hypothetical protein